MAKNVKLTDFPEQEHEFFRANYLSLMDGEIDIQTKNRLLKHFGTFDLNTNIFIMLRIP